MKMISALIALISLNAAFVSAGRCACNGRNGYAPVDGYVHVAAFY
jgi:hypothetical protein